MEDNSLLVIVLAFVLGCMCSRMMKQMCGQRLVEGRYIDDNNCYEPGNRNVIKTRCSKLSECNRSSFYYDVNAGNNRPRIPIVDNMMDDLSCDGGFCKYTDQNKHVHQLCHDQSYF